MIQIKKTNKKGNVQAASFGVTLAIGSLFIFLIGIPVTNEVLNSMNVSGLTANVLSFVPVVFAASYLWMAARDSGVMGNNN